MVKVRMNPADVKCLRRLIGMRYSNVYDLSPKTYVFKLMNNSGVSESSESEKVLVLMESGVRLHTIVYMRDKSNTPSGFNLKLRKHIRMRRLEDVRQLGYDRTVLFQFGLGENAHYVILELYAQGNILLTDSNFTVMTLLRSHRMKTVTKFTVALIFTLLHSCIVWHKAYFSYKFFGLGNSFLIGAFLQDGSSFKSKFRFQPYFYVATKYKMEMDVEAYLRKKTWIFCTLWLDLIQVMRFIP